MAEKTTIDCGTRLSIDQAESLYQSFETALLTGADLSLKAGDVQFSDTAGLQMIISLKKTLAQTGHDITWKNVSDNLKETAGYLGLTEPLNLSAQ
jgi:anti-anti-sigma regulatory factor